jgi:hypothetical protein
MHQLPRQIHAAPPTITGFERDAYKTTFYTMPVVSWTDKQLADKTSGTTVAIDHVLHCHSSHFRFWLVPLPPC